MLKLDFTITTTADREKYIENYIIGKTFSSKELETIADYILYGKDPDNNNSSIVDRKEVQIKTKYSSYSKKEPESLDSLMESPTFDERIFKPRENHIKFIKPKIDREKDKDIPGIQELWKTIDYYQNLIDANLGKLSEEESSKYRKLSSLELYKIKHMLIDLRRQQFYLKDSVKPTELTFGTSAHKQLPIYEEESINWDIKGSNYAIAPLGLFIGKDLKFINPREYNGIQYNYDAAAKYILDFRNPLHIYFLLEHYEDLSISNNKNPDSTVQYILDTLNFYIDFANLSETKQTILKMKIKKYSNLEINRYLKKEFNLNHSDNYISTIWKQKICGDIAAAASLHYDYYLNRENKFNWKKCSQCGQFKLKDTREFMRNSRSSDGLANRCKRCDKENRLKRK